MMTVYIIVCPIHVNASYILDDELDSLHDAHRVNYDGDLSEYDNLPFTLDSVNNVVAFDDGTLVVFVDVDENANDDESAVLYDGVASSRASTTWYNIYTGTSGPPSVSGRSVYYVPWDVMGYDVYQTSGSTATINYPQWQYAAGTVNHSFLFQTQSFTVPSTYLTSLNSYDRGVFGFQYKGSSSFSYVNSSTSTNTYLSARVNEMYFNLSFLGKTYKLPLSANDYFFVFVDLPVASVVFSFQPVVDATIDYYGGRYVSNFAYSSNYMGTVSLDASFDFLSYTIFGSTYLSTGDKQIVDAIDVVNSTLITLNSNLLKWLTNVINKIDSFSNRNHDDIINLDTHMVQWLKLIHDDFMDWFNKYYSNLLVWLTNVIKAVQEASRINHADLLQIHTDLTSYDGSAGGLKGSNEDFKSEMDAYNKNTDTSAQYGKISDDIFDLDTGFFTSLASTATFFSSLVTMAFNSLGDMAVALQLFLVMVFVSMILGIVSHVRGGGD